jgi:hypothetical protein
MLSLIAHKVFIVMASIPTPLNVPRERTEIPRILQMWQHACNVHQEKLAHRMDSQHLMEIVMQATIVKVDRGHLSQMIWIHFKLQLEVFV